MKSGNTTNGNPFELEDENARLRAKIAGLESELSEARSNLKAQAKIAVEMADLDLKLNGPEVKRLREGLRQIRNNCGEGLAMEIDALLTPEAKERHIGRCVCGDNLTADHLKVCPNQEA